MSIHPLYSPHDYFLLSAWLALEKGTHIKVSEDLLMRTRWLWSTTADNSFVLFGIFFFFEQNKSWGLVRWLNWQLPYASLINLSFTDILSSVKYRSHKIICYKLVLVIKDVGSSLSVLFVFHCRTVLYPCRTQENKKMAILWFSVMIIWALVQTKGLLVSAKMGSIYSEAVLKRMKPGVI